jgi:hypothetical protein
VAAIEAEVRRDREIPHRTSDLTDSEYQSMLTKLSIRDVRAATFATRASVDVSLIAPTSEPQQIENILADAFLTKDADVIRRVGLAAEARAQRLAAAEARRGTVLNGAASQTYFRISGRLKTWRSEQTNGSPEVRRLKAIDAAEARKRQIRQARAWAEQGLGVEATMQRLARQEVVASLQANVPKTNVTMGPALQRGA